MVATCMLHACSSDENTIATQQGYLSLSTNINGSFTMSDGSTYSLPESQVPDFADFSLTLSLGDQYSHTWQSITSFPENESYSVGQYTILMAADSKNDGPVFWGEQSVNINAAQRTIAAIECTPSDALLAFNLQNSSSSYSLNNITVHSDGARYADPISNGNVFIVPGEMHLYAQLSDAQQRSIRVAMPYITSIEAAHGEAINVNLSGNSINFSSPKKNISYTIDSSIFDLSAPSITPVGFEPGVEVKATEGLTLSSAVKMLANSNREIAKAYLTVESPILNIVGAPSELDLMKLSANDNSYLAGVGLKFSIADDKKSINIDYTNLLENMASYTSALSHFTLMIEDAAGVCSDPLTLDVNTQVMSLNLESVSGATIGENKATMQINASGQDMEQPDFKIYTVNTDGEQVECPITGWKQVSKTSVEVEFTVPEGDTDLSVDVYYLDLKRFSATVKRLSPKFSFEIDAFATNAVVRFNADNEDIDKALTKYGKVTINGSPVVISERYENLHAVLVSNLQPAKQYTAGVYVANGESQTMKFTTESDEQIPEGDFEDWEQLINYKQLPQGGKYSSTELSIVNRQNYVDIDVKWPKKYWASINAKTFNKQSTRHNSWYMQPSSVIIYEPQSGYKAICITSVGWDHDGEAIADYVQKHGESLPYSNVVPKVSHRSAGRLFLGSYSYNITTGTETFNEGYAFTSRPSSLNGFYKYTPDETNQSDRGYVEIEIINITNGTETVIASGRAELQSTTDYKAFNVPLTYKYYNLKASRLKIMFASTTATGTQDYEDSHVPVTAHPEKGVLSGSSLWIDNLSFTY